MKVRNLKYCLAKTIAALELMRFGNLCKGLAKRLGVVAVAGGMSLGLASDGYAATITIPDSGFENHVIDDLGLS